MILQLIVFFFCLITSITSFSIRAFGPRLVSDEIYRRSTHHYEVRTGLTVEATTLSPTLQLIDAVSRSLLINKDFHKLLFTDMKLNTKLLPSDEVKISQEAKSNYTDLKSVSGRLVTLKSGLCVQFNYRYRTNDQVKNYPVTTGGIETLTGKIQELIDHGFQKIMLQTTTEVYDLNLKRGSQGKFRVTPISKTLEISSNATMSKNEFTASIQQHDRQKNVLVDNNASFLKELGITTDGGRPLVGMADKLRQIQKFVEILSNLIDRVEPKSEEVTGVNTKRKLRITDMGSGLAYLTFAVHSYFSSFYDLETVGIENRKSLVDQTNSLARKLGVDFDGLKFVTGDIADFNGADLFGKAVVEPSSVRDNSFFL